MQATLDDIKLGFRVARALGLLDIGQGAVVARQYVLAVEAAEGTDAMLRRCRDLNNWGFKSRKGVLVKAPKPGQDLRLDMPVIGPRTVELASEAGLAGSRLRRERFCSRISKSLWKKPTSSAFSSMAPHPRR